MKYLFLGFAGMAFGMTCVRIARHFAPPPSLKYWAISLGLCLLGNFIAHGISYWWTH